MDIINEIKENRKEMNNNNFLKYFKSFLETIKIYKFLASCFNNNENENYNKINNDNNNIQKININKNKEVSNEMSKIVFLP